MSTDSQVCIAGSGKQMCVQTGRYTNIQCTNIHTSRQGSTDEEADGQNETGRQTD